MNIRITLARVSERIAEQIVDVLVPLIRVEHVHATGPQAFGLLTEPVEVGMLFSSERVQMDWGANCECASNSSDLSLRCRGLR